MLFVSPVGGAWVVGVVPSTLVDLWRAQPGLGLALTITFAFDMGGPDPESCYRRDPHRGGWSRIARDVGPGPVPHLVAPPVGRTVLCL